MAEGSEQDNAHVILFKVLYHALESALELKHLTRHDVGKAGYTADTVAEGHDLTGLEYVDIAADLFKLMPDALGYGQSLLIALAGVYLNVPAEPVKSMRQGTVIDRISDLHTHAADEPGIDLVVAGDEGLADYLRELIHFLLAQGLCALY